MDGKVESIRYDEIVFNEPTENMFALLTKQPGTLLDDKLKSKEREELDRIAKAIDDLTAKVTSSAGEFKKLDAERTRLLEL
jgi:YEATS domain-containing protein 4